MRLTAGLEKLDLYKKKNLVGLLGKPQIRLIDFSSKGKTTIHNHTQSDSIFNWEDTDIKEPRQDLRQSRSRKDKMPKSSNLGGTAPQVLTAEAAVAMMNAAI